LYLQIFIIFLTLQSEVLNILCCMNKGSFDESRVFSMLRLFARFTSGLSRLTVILLTLLGLILLVPITGATADWLVKQNEGNKKGVRPFLYAFSDTSPPICVGNACNLSTLPITSLIQPGGEASIAAAAHILWPAPVLIQASPDTYLEVVGATDRRSPSVERKGGKGSATTGSNFENLGIDSTPLLIAYEVHANGNRRPILVDTEGFLSAWGQDGLIPSGQLTPWAPAVALESKDQTQNAATEHIKQLRDMKMHTIQFQPVPNAIELDVFRSALIEQIQPGYVMVFDWQLSGVLNGQFHQVVPSRSMIGVVKHSQEIGQYLRLKVEIPRSSPYGGSNHWLGTRLRALQQGEQTLLSDVQAVFFRPNQMLGATPNWTLLERIFQELPMANVLRVAMGAIDPKCAEPAIPSNSCIWVRLHGVAVPVQVSTRAIGGNDLAISERAVFAGKALRAVDWAAMPTEFRREFGSPSELGDAVSRNLLGANTRLLIAPQPWLKAGLTVSIDDKSGPVKK
jgi:hypothetical protein